MARAELSQLTHINKIKTKTNLNSRKAKMTQSSVPPVICEICSQTFDKEDLKTKATVHFLGKTHQRRMFQSDYKKPAIFLPGKIHTKS